MEVIAVKSVMMICLKLSVLIATTERILWRLNKEEIAVTSAQMVLHVGVTVNQRKMLHIMNKRLSVFAVSCKSAAAATAAAATTTTTTTRTRTRQQREGVTDRDPW
jgi:hypothetical protein